MSDAGRDRQESQKTRGALLVLREIAPLVGVLAASVCVAGMLVAAGPVAAGDDDDVAEFDHQAHLARGVECGDCHTGVDEEDPRSRAGVPSIAICAELCHADFDDETRARLAESQNGRRMLTGVDDGVEPWWPRAYWLPDHVVFSHRRHVSIGEIDCAECHGDMESATTLPREPIEATVTMEGCTQCHEERGASNDCFRCHR